MKLKKTITMMLIAGMLTASLASCVVKGNGDDPQDSGGTEPYIPITTNKNETPTTPSISNTDPTKISYTVVDETVYTISNASLKKADNVNESITLGELTELKRVGKHATWSKVEYNGTAYFIATSLITTDDLMEKTFQTVNKELFVDTASVNVREYPSAEDFSEILGSRVQDDQVKVIAQNAKWSKIEWTDNGVTKHGFIKSEFLSETKGGVSESDYINNFTTFDSPITMYVSTPQVNLRKHPYADNKVSPIVTSLDKGNSVVVIAEGTVNKEVWYAVEWTENSVKSTCYVAKECLSRISGNATLAEILDQYSELKAFDAAKTLYITESAFGRSTPTRVKVDNEDNIIKLLYKADAVTALASGKISGQDPSGNAEELVWCLIQDSELGYYFVSMNVLTSDPSGKPSAPVLTLEELIATYGFSALTNPVTMKTNAEVKPWGSPDADSRLEEVTIAAGTTVQVLAQGETKSGLTTNKWYIIEYNGAHYFIIQSLVDLA